MPLFNKKIKLLLIAFTFYSTTYSQENISDIKVKQFAKEVYGNFKEYQTPEALKDYKNYLQRVTILKDHSVELKKFSKHKILPLSSIRIKNKYTNITYDNHTNFNTNKFNALKYAFNFESKEDQIFQINGTKNYVLIKAKK